MGSFGRTATSRPAVAPADPDAGVRFRQLLLIWAAGFACSVILISGNIDITPARGLVFNEMLVRLLHGRFDISLATIGDEAIVHQGRTYAYFGIFCALLRLVGYDDVLSIEHEDLLLPPLDGVRKSVVLLREAI